MNAIANKLTKYNKAIVDDYAIMTYSNKGVAAKIFDDILNVSGISKDVLAENILDISVKTMFRYQKENKKLNARLSEIALKFVSLLNKGIEVFGDINSFRNWLNKPAYGLGNQIPIELLNTNTGMDLVEEELLRIEFGALA